MAPEAVLIIGRRPPPIGGVTMHVERLCRSLQAAGVAIRTIDPRRDGAWHTLAALRRHRVSHVHLSHPAAMFACAALARLCGNACVLTVHGNLGRFSGWRRTLARAAVRLARVPLLLNDESLRDALTLNPRARQTSAFIPPRDEPALPAGMDAALRAHAMRGGVLVASNAFDLAYDDAGREIYGIFELIDWCRARGHLLVVSDPSGNYAREAKRRLDEAQREHVLFLCGAHSFSVVLAQADMFVRHTLTDGDSLSIHEALSLGKPVWATRVVARPPGTFTYERLEQIDAGRRAAADSRAPQVVAELARLYRDLASKNRIRT
jgi:glycosyltransferase involved in cell wall biosynthesis